MLDKLRRRTGDELDLTFVLKTAVKMLTQEIAELKRRSKFLINIHRHTEKYGRIRGNRV